MALADPWEPQEAALLQDSKQLQPQAAAALHAAPTAPPIGAGDSSPLPAPPRPLGRSAWRRGSLRIPSSSVRDAANQSPRGGFDPHAVRAIPFVLNPRAGGAAPGGAGGPGDAKYQEIVRVHEDARRKMGMFTEDAWEGMMRLRDYDRAVERIAEEERQCRECTRNRRLLEQVWQTVSNEYFDQYGSFSQAKWSGELTRSLERAEGPLRTKAQTYAAAQEMVAALGDKYSAFLDPFHYRLAIHHPIPSEIKYLAYQYTGIGIELGKHSDLGGLTVVAPFAGSPAEEGGILGGERLLEIDGLSVDPLTSDEAVALLRGPIGSTVDVQVAGVEQGAPPRAIALERRALPLPPLKMRMVQTEEGKLVEYIRLHYFTHQGTRDMAAAIRQGEAMGVDGYILDLRNNPGGVFEEAIAMAALWLDCPHCDVAETVRGSSVSLVEDSVYQVGKLPSGIFGRHPGALTHAPLAVLTNRSSASASEVLTGALRDNRRATVIGEKTYGKGVVQYYFPMDDGSGLKLTVAKYLTPARYDITTRGGISPDLECSDYPHGSSSLDECIQKGIAAVRRTEELRDYEKEPPFDPLPYRWVPLNTRRLWASGTY